MQVSEYSIGDTVVHPNGAKGIVIGIGPCRFPDLGLAVQVEFDPVPKPGYPKRKWKGEYSQNWLNTHELRKIDPTP